MLKHEYKETPTLEEALQLAIRVLNKTLDSTKLSAEKGAYDESRKSLGGELHIMPTKEVKMFAWCGKVCLLLCIVLGVGLLMKFAPSCSLCTHGLVVLKTWPSFFKLHR